MFSIEWAKKYSTGIAFLDIGNEHFAETSNQLLQILQSHAECDSHQDLILSIIAHAQDHFKCEEAFLRNFNLDELEEHCQQHSIFLDNLKEFSGNLSKENREAKVQLCQFIRDWYVFHVTHMDQHIAVAIKNSIEQYI